MPSDQYQTMLETLHEQMAAKNAARESALAISRKLIRVAAHTIRATHRHEHETAQAGLRDGAELVNQIRAATDGHPDIFHAGYTQDAMKEFAEAHATVALVAGDPLPGIEEIGVEPGAYLNGVGEAIGELRRAILDAIRDADTERAESLLARAEEVHAALMTFDYPDALTGGLRRTTDAMRGLLERTRGDVVMAVRQARLEARLVARERDA